MNSGIRFSVALIVVVVVLLGLYYAGLDDEDQTGGGATPPVEVAAGSDGSPVTTPETTPVDPGETIPAPPPVEVEAPTPEPDSTDEGTPSIEPEPTEFDEFPAAMDEASTDATAGSTESDPSTTEVDDSTIDEAAETDAPDEPGEELDPTSESDDSAAEPETSEEETADAVDTPDDAVTSGEDSGSGSAEAAPARGGPGRSADAGGVGIHRLASISREPELATSAMRAISQAESAGVIPGPSRSAWIPVPSGTDETLLADAIVGRVPGDDTIHMLVLTDDANAVDLAGRIASTTINGSSTTGAWQVQFRPTAEALEAVRNGTRPQVGAAVAWIGNGRAIVVHRPVLPVSGRGVVPTTCRSEAEAEAIVAALERRAGEAPTSDSSAPASSPSTGRDSGAPSVVNGAGSLPPEMYTAYTVKPGDNFEKIAEAWFGDRSKSSLIAEANPYAESSRLSVGQELRLPPKDLEFETEIPGPDPATGLRVYRIRSGDTLGKIAQRVYGKASEWPRIHEANKDVIGENPGNIRVGMEIILP